MQSALQKIITRAKQLQKKHPNTAWKKLVQDASREYRGGKLGSVKKASASRQTGTSNKGRDKMIKAKTPGKRKSYQGNVYYERRKNRSDKPGTLTGISAGSLAGELRKRYKGELSKALLAREMATTVKARRSANERISNARDRLKRL